MPPHLFLGSLRILSFSCQGGLQDGNGSVFVQHSIVLVAAHALDACRAAAGGAAVAAHHQLQRFRQQLREQRLRLHPFVCLSEGARKAAMHAKQPLVDRQLQPFTSCSCGNCNCACTCQEAI